MNNKFSGYVYTERLRRERYAKHLSLKEMAKLLEHQSPSSYKNLEDGVVEPKISDMNRVSEILEKPVEYFFALRVQETQTIDEQSA